MLVLMKPGKMTLKHKAVPAKRYAAAGINIIVIW